MNTVTFFEIQADDLARAKNFYTTIFGWQFVKQENIATEYWRIKTESIDGGLLKRPAQRPSAEQGTNAFVCSMLVEDFDATAKVIQANGGGIALEKFAVPGICWQGYFTDTEGNTFGIFQPDEHAR